MKKNLGVLLAYLAVGLLPVLFWAWPPPLQALSLNQSLAGFLRYVPILMLAGAGIMGWKLNLTRVLLASFLCLALYLLLLRVGMLFPASAVPALADVLCISLPLSFALAVAGTESPLADRRFARRLFLTLFPLAVLGGAALWMGVEFAAVAGWKPAGMGRLFGLPWLAAGTAVLYWISVGLSRDRRIRGFALALGLALVPLMFAALSLAGGAGRAVAGLPGAHINTAFLAVSVIVFHSVFSMYWYRVYMDELTCVPNRRALEEELQNAGGGYVVAMMDIDHFKAYNDRFGHEEGDNVLRMVASHLERELESRVYRYGGEEFCAVWRGQSVESAFQVTERARCSLEKRVFHVRQPRHEAGSSPPDSALGVAVGVTISAGLATAATETTPSDEVIRLADEALYEAKRTGRNRTVVAGG